MKICSSCGKELSKNEEFCQSCDTNVLTMEETSALVGSVESRKPSKAKFSKKWLLIAIIPVLLIGGGSALGMFFLSKSPKALFLMSEYNSYQQISEDLNEKYGEDLAFQEKLMESPSSSEIKLSGNLEMDSEYNYETEMIKEFLGQSAIILQIEQDPIKQASHQNLALEVDGTKAVEIEFFQTDSIAGLKIPMLYDQFFYLNFDEYGELRRMFDPYYEGNETLEVGNLKWDDLMLSEKEKATIQKRYSSFLLDELNEENFSLKKNVTYKHEGENLNLREITFELSPSETEDLISNLFNQLIEDEELHSLIADRVVKIAEDASTEELYDEEFTDKSYVKKELKSRLVEMKEEAKQIKYPDGFKYVLMIDKKEQIIDRQIKLAVAIEGSDIAELVVSTKNVPMDKDRRFKELKFEISPEDIEAGKMEFGYNNTITTHKNNRTEDLKVYFHFEENGYGEEGLELAVQSVFKGKNPGKQTIEREFDFQTNGDDFYEVPLISGSIKQENDISVKEKYANKSFDIKVQVKDEYNQGTVSIAVNSKTKLKDKIDLPKIDTSNDQNVVELTEYDLYDIVEEMQYRLAETLGNLGIDSY